MKTGRQICTWSALAALLLATLYAPLFHVHSESAEAPLVHAHLPELEAFEDESVVHMEAPHGHAHARSIDLLVTAPAHGIHLDAVLISRNLEPDLTEPHAGFKPVTTTRAHDPPSNRPLIPRAPPA
jgi:hypothetical protein